MSTLNLLYRTIRHWFLSFLSTWIAESNFGLVQISLWPRPGLATHRSIFSSTKISSCCLGKTNFSAYGKISAEKQLISRKKWLPLAYVRKSVKISAGKKLMFKKKIFMFLFKFIFFSRKIKCVSCINISIGPPLASRTTVLESLVYTNNIITNMQQ